MSDIETNAGLTDIDTNELHKVEGGMYGLENCPGWVAIGGIVTGPLVPTYCFIAWL